MNYIFNSFFLGSLFLSLFNSLSNSSLLYSLPLLFLKLFNIGYFVIKNDEKKISEIIKILQNTTSSTITLYEFGKIRPIGIFIGWKYIGSYHDSPSEHKPNKELYLITFNSIFKKLVDQDEYNDNYSKLESKLESIYKTDEEYIEPKKINNKIVIYERAGGYFRLYYEKRIFNISKYYPTMYQEPIINSIKNIYNQKKSSSIFISGRPGSGKSMIGFLLAKELNAKLVRTFNPTEPGDTMIAMIREIEPSEESPLVLMLDEADILIKKIISGQILPHKNIPIMINDKITFNRFMDDMIFYDNVILILTSNESKENIDSIDPSFLRKGRIDDFFVL